MEINTTNLLARLLAVSAALILSLICAGILIVPAVQFSAWWLWWIRRFLIRLIVIGWRVYVWRFERRIRQQDKREIVQLRESLTKKELEIVLGARHATSLEQQLNQKRRELERLEATVKDMRLTESIRRSESD